jgi:aminopeptidase N
MPSYLVAFAVGQLYRVSAGDGLQNLVVREEYTESYMFPLRRLPKIMELLVSAMDYELPLSKLDHVALPRFGGGMENWGMIIYGYAVLLPIQHDFKEKTRRNSARSVHRIF